MTTMRTLFVSIACTVLAACDPGGPIANNQPDQCMRAALFAQCMAQLPKGPERITAAGNDWSEVVSACEKSAYYMSIRLTSQVKMECRVQ